MQKKQIPPVVKDALQEAATNYANSPHTTNAGRWLRLLAKILPVSTVIKIFSHQLKK